MVFLNTGYNERIHLSNYSYKFNRVEAIEGSSDVVYGQ